MGAILIVNTVDDFGNLCDDQLKIKNLPAAEKAGARCSVTTWWMCAADSAAAGLAPLGRMEWDKQGLG